MRTEAVGGRADQKATDVQLHRILSVPTLALIAALSGPVLAQENPDAPVVMLLGVYHFANPGLDVVNIQADDVSSPERQAEIKAINDQLVMFRPTVVAVEEVASSASLDSPTFAAWQAGQRDSRGERDQIGFRVARQSEARIASVDVDMPLPFGPLMQAAGNAAPDVLARVMSTVQEDATATSTALAAGSIADALIVLNSPEALSRASSLYYIPLGVTSDQGETLPGVELAKIWYERNLRICVNLMALAKPGERVLVIYGSSHIPQLAQCLSEAGIRLEDPLPYLVAAR